jgi:hypothetical protein
MDMPKETSNAVQYVRRTGAGTSYSDYLNVNWNYAGFKINFASYVPFSEAGGEARRTVEEVAAVGLSPEHTQQLHRILGEQLEEYAKRFGEIRPEPKPAEVEDSE